MADTRYRVTSKLLPIRAESGKLILPDQVGSRIENMYLTEEGTLRSVWGPAPYVPDYGDGSPVSYTDLKGIFHTTLGADDQRDLLIIQDGSAIKVLEGWNTSGAVWRTLIAPSGVTATFNADFGYDTKPRFPTQFEATPNGIVIIPSGDSSRAYFFDGYAVAPLGYESSPSPPQGFSPESAGEDWYVHTGLTMARSSTGGPPSEQGTFGQGRVGSVSLDSVNPDDAGRIIKGSYRSAVQWLDKWGNLSPLSGRSGAVLIPAKKASDISGEAEGSVGLKMRSTPAPQNFLRFLRM